MKPPVDTTLVDKYDNRYWVDKSVALQAKVMRQREKIAEFDSKQAEIKHKEAEVRIKLCNVLVIGRNPP